MNIFDLKKFGAVGLLSLMAFNISAQEAGKSDAADWARFAYPVDTFNQSTGNLGNPELLGIAFKDPNSQGQILEYSLGAEESLNRLVFFGRDVPSAELGASVPVGGRPLCQANVIAAQTLAGTPWFGWPFPYLSGSNTGFALGSVDDLNTSATPVFEVEGAYFSDTFTAVIEVKEGKKYTRHYTVAYVDSKGGHVYFTEPVPNGDDPAIPRPLSLGSVEKWTDWEMEKAGMKPMYGDFAKGVYLTRKGDRAELAAGLEKEKCICEPPCEQLQTGTIVIAYGATDGHGHPVIGKVRLRTYTSRLQFTGHEVVVKDCVQAAGVAFAPVNWYGPAEKVRVMFGSNHNSREFDLRVGRIAEWLPEVKHSFRYLRLENDQFGNPLFEISSIASSPGFYGAERVPGWSLFISQRGAQSAGALSKIVFGLEPVPVADKP